MILSYIRTKDGFMQVTLLYSPNPIRPSSVAILLTILRRFPANTQRSNNVVTTSLQRRDVVTTLLRHCVFAWFTVAVLLCSYFSNCNCPKFLSECVPYLFSSVCLGQALLCEYGLDNTSIRTNFNLQILFFVLICRLKLQ